MMLSIAIDEIEEILEYNFYINFEETQSIEDAKKRFIKAPQLIKETYKYINDVGCDAFFTSDKKGKHDFNGKVILFLHSFYWLFDEKEESFNLMVNEIPAIRKKYSIFFMENDINIYKYEITQYAKNDELEKATKIYKALSSLEQTNEIIAKELKTKNNFINEWEWYI